MHMRRSTTVLTAFLLLFLLPIAPGKAEDDPLPPAVRERLTKDRIALGGDLKQVFSAYLQSKVPPFVTSDALLAGYHCLFEESVRRLEMTRAWRLSGVLGELLGAVDEEAQKTELPAELRAAAVRRVRLTIAVAVELLGRELPGLSAEERELVRTESSRVQAAKGSFKPEWLGPPDPECTAIDYARFKPQGFYAGSPMLSAYWRAVAWLQAVPFRVDRTEEFLGFLLMRAAASRVDGREVLTGYAGLTGAGDEPCLTEEGLPEFSIATLKDLRAAQALFAEQIRRPLIHGEISIREIGASLRILPRARMPGSILFSRIANETDDHPMPGGLAVAAALGSAFARERIPAAWRKLAATTAPRFVGLDLHRRYLACLATLLDGPDPRAPKLFSSKPWAAKSCRTALAGWALARHTWALQAKMSVHLLGAVRVHAGFVEPEPEFFTQLAELCASASELLAAGGAFGPTSDRLELAEDVAAFLALLDRYTGEELILELLFLGRENLLERAYFVARTAGFKPDTRILEWETADWTRLREILKKVLADLRDPNEKDPPTGKVEDPFSSVDRLNLSSSWEELEHLCTWAAQMARKQLAGEAFDASDWMSFKSFGTNLAGVMLYLGNSYLMPRDDAPRIADVHLDPARGRRLLVGSGRPRQLFILYPTKNGDVLCLGAALTYYEFENDRPLTDAEWRSLLSSRTPPKMPEWAR